MDLKAVSPATVPVWRIQGLIVSLIAAAGAGVVLFPGLLPAVFRFGVPAALLVAGILLSWFLPPAWYRRLRYGVDDTGIAIRRGIFWRSRIALPRIRIQHTDVSQGPLQRRYGVGTLKLYTAGSRYTKIELPGLEHEAATDLRDELLREGHGDAV